MSSHDQAVFAAAMQLSAENRAILAEQLLDSLQDQPKIDPRWKSEIDRRAQEVKQGTARIIPGEDYYRTL